jgi:hypothetical protein
LTSLFAAIAAFLVVPAAQTHAGAVARSITKADLIANDTDFFSQGEVLEDNVIFGIVTPVAAPTSQFSTPNTQVATFIEGNLGNPLTFNDDSLAHYQAGQDYESGSLGSLFRLKSEMTNNYTVGVTGSNDGFTGSGHNQAGDYLLTVGHVDPLTGGGDFADTDPQNDVLGSADVITLGGLEAKVAVNWLEEDDVDYYSIDLQEGDIFTAMTAPLNRLEDHFNSPDTVMHLFDSNVIELFNDDDSGGDESDSPTDGEAWGSALHFLVPQTGTYYLAVTGYNEEFRLGKHREKGDYGLLVSNYRIPEPATLSLLMLGVYVLAGSRPQLAAGSRRNAES